MKRSHDDKEFYELSLAEQIYIFARDNNITNISDKRFKKFMKNELKLPESIISYELSKKKKKK